MKKRTPKQIAALLCVVLLVAMYLVTFIVAFLDPAEFGHLFTACLLSTIGLPILLWLFIWFYGIMKERQTGMGLPHNADLSDEPMSMESVSNKPGSDAAASDGSSNQSASEKNPAQ